MTTEVAGILKRLEDLELRNSTLQRQNRRLKWAGAASVFLVISLSVSCTSKAPTGPKVVEAEEFVLKGPDGKKQGMLKAGPNGPLLILMRGGEPTGAMIGLGAVKDTGETGIAIYDKNGKLRILLAAPPDDKPGLRLYDESEKEKATLAMSSLGPALIFSDGPDQPRVALLSTNTVSGLSLTTTDKASMILEAQNAQMQRFMILDGKKRPRAGMVVGKEGPGIDLFDENGRPLFSKP